MKKGMSKPKGGIEGIRLAQLKDTTDELERHAKQIDALQKVTDMELMLILNSSIVSVAELEHDATRRLLHVIGFMFHQANSYYQAMEKKPDVEKNKELFMFCQKMLDFLLKGDAELLSNRFEKLGPSMDLLINQMKLLMNGRATLSTIREFLSTPAGVGVLPLLSLTPAEEKPETPPDNKPHKEYVGEEPPKEGEGKTITLKVDSVSSKPKNKI